MWNYKNEEGVATDQLTRLGSRFAARSSLYLSIILVVCNTHSARSCLMKASSRFCVLSCFPRNQTPHPDTHLEYPDANLFYRDILGIHSVSKQTCSNILKAGPGSVITIVVEGAADLEGLSTLPGTADLTLKRRLGFIKFAIQHGTVFAIWSLCFCVVKTMFVSLFLCRLYEAD
ncbi:uncharacterized protein LACBIDRAFT_299515 [Laccaria bicolor S238N-H82]|uniref:Predicted protein n=1 Tax=Laccaria bicolor (strain S238N-H82 / ATCC MYA-4686) TaxID=486041 RepID=B0DTE0_LACBS|nr:uncharacterized protein LACBIDRAFT_309974 [Laccaria bicolor S238N-H82]XP_001890818.1 uncharacterized protein LACBIDRAFT_299515 [Laccaria bicolor S238N-H82]EDQ98533.1 predicted protein [Laccaria bicolor S238N-H82]EDR02096.1 predicted protein [Laccaria bicolor S238N-H82]|eukprot:XP_001887253.1 predicted protein [Laccaria bicolor S238N-H82]